MIMKVLGFLLTGALVLASCTERSKDTALAEPGQGRDPAKILTMNLGSFDEKKEQLRLQKFVGSVEIDHSNSDEELKRRAVGAGESDRFKNIAICPIFRPESGALTGRYALTRKPPVEGDWSAFSLAQPTSLPLILSNYDWGFTTPEQHSEYHQEFRDFLSNLSDEIEVVDLTWFRVPERFFGDFSGMPNVRVMAMPWSSFDSVSKRFDYPKNLEELTFYNIRLNGILSGGDNELESLSRLVLNGCWIDAPLSYPPFAAPDDFDRGVLPFGDVSKTIEAIDFTNCDNRSLLSMLYFRWDNLQSISFRRSFRYPRQDGIELFDYVIWMILEDYISQFPSLEEISLHFNDMNQPANAKNLLSGEARPIEKRIGLKNRLEMMAQKASIEVHINVE